jgi:hypothetical protein
VRAPRLFTLTIAGETCHGLAWDSEEARDEFLAARGIVLVAESSPAEPPPPPDEPEPVIGRPSKSTIIAAAIDELGDDRLGACDSVADQVRVIRAHLQPADVAEGTVRNYLKLNPVPCR